MDEDKIKEILDEKQEQNNQQNQQQRQKKTFWNNTRTVKGKALSAWLVVMIAIFMLFTFGIGIYLGKELFANKESGNTEKQNNTETTNTEINPTPTTPVKQLETFDLANFDPTKSIDKKENVSYGSTVSGVSSNFALQGYIQADIIGTKISDDKKTVTVTVNWDGIKEIYPNLNGKPASEYSISFDKNVRAVYVSGWGQGMGQETIFYLMEDGTVEYTPVTTKVVTGLAGAVESFSLKSYGAIPGVEGVVILAHGDEVPTNSEFGGGMVILGIKSTGDFYDLSAKLGGTDPYKYY